MDPQTGAIAEKDFERALKELEQGNVLAALACLEHALQIWDDPRWYSRLGFCIAKERGMVTKALQLCRAAIAHEPENPVHYLYLGKVHLISGNSIEALQVFREGMAQGGNPELEQLLDEIGTRKSPVLPFLSRENRLNKFLGIILRRLGVR
jgi:tetratricopeptide (TPR) repeat protein